MPSHVIDSRLLRDLYGTPAMRRVFDDEGLLQKWLDYEAALARAEANVGILKCHFHSILSSGNENKSIEL